MGKVESPAQARALLYEETRIVRVDVEDSSDPNLVVVAIVGVW